VVIVVIASLMVFVLYGVVFAAAVVVVVVIAVGAVAFGGVVTFGGVEVVVIGVFALGILVTAFLEHAVVGVVVFVGVLDELEDGALLDEVAAFVVVVIGVHVGALIVVPVVNLEALVVESVAAVEFGASAVA